uniref:HSF-type DNA-binding domain-containing protein n=1 Tax=Amphimedon queenslandica TaxID=400682 RepID=A0A1X7UCX9_AMPQE
MYFKHKAFASFIRQLHHCTYRFRKVSRPGHEYWHVNFWQDHPELLHRINMKEYHSVKQSLQSGHEQVQD